MVREVPELIPQPDEIHDSIGVVIPLCIVHELQPRRTMRRQAVATLAGYSVCREHIEFVAAWLAEGLSTAEIIRLMQDRED